MKKYCLTNCAKQKLSGTKKAFIDFTIALLFVVVVVSAFMLLSFILGFIGQGLWVTFIGPLTPLPAVSFFEFGAIVFLILAVASTVCFLIYKTLVGLYIMTRTLITNTSIKKNYWGEEVTCHIFEECVEENKEKEK